MTFRVLEKKMKDVAFYFEVVFKFYSYTFNIFQIYT